jgi:predicted proteasome-type protease
MQFQSVLCSFCVFAYRANNGVSKTSVFGTLLKLSRNGEKRLFLCAETRLKIKVPKAAPF